MTQRPTMKQIAARAGVSTATVSLALRDDHRLPPETRAKIQALAREMHYRPDPFLSALSAYRSGREPARNASVLAWLTAWPTRDGWRERIAFRGYFEGAAARARQLGYRLEHFWMPDHGGARTARVLHHRGIRGVLVAPLPSGQFTLDFDFSAFAALQIGRSLHDPRLPSVTHNHYLGMRLAVRTLIERGYKRLGFAILESHDRIQDHRWSAAFLASRERLPNHFADDPLYHPDKWVKRDFLAWQRRQRCDVLLSDEPMLHEWLVGDGRKIPEKLGFACTAVEERGKLSGVLLDAPTLGALAVTQLHSQLATARSGIPAQHESLVLEGEWHEGQTLRPPTRSRMNSTPSGCLL